MSTYDIDIVAHNGPGHTPDILNLQHYKSLLTYNELDTHLYQKSFNIKQNTVTQCITSLIVVLICMKMFLL